MDALVEELLTKDVYIVDYLPRTVPKNSGGQYFDVEYYLLNSPRHTALKDKFSSVIFKLMCYYRVCIPCGSTTSLPKLWTAIPAR